MDKAVYCNREKILRVFQNILENAGQALEGKGNIWFETRDLYMSGQEMLEIHISNNGLPIPKEFIPKLFDPFFSKGKKHGTGLGLSILITLADAFAVNRYRNGHIAGF